MKILVLGGGIGGMAAAIKLKQAGHTVELVEKSEDWKALGTGLTLSVLTLRALCDLGLQDEIAAQGFVHDGVDIYDQQGNFIRTVLSKRVIADDFPSEGAILRPVLHDILSKKVQEQDIPVFLGDSVSEIRGSLEHGNFVKFESGREQHYDLAVGADGVFSKLRQLLMPEQAAPEYTGQACWRLQFDRPADIVRGRMFQSENMKVGFNPCSPTQMYMYMMECVPKEKVWREPEDLPRIAKQLLQEFEPVLKPYIDSINAETPIIYRPLERVMVNGDWHRGAALLIGDAVHATTPHLGSGAGLAVEDAIVLSQVIDQFGDDLGKVFTVFMQKRLERALFVVETSGEIGRMEIAGESMMARSILLAKGFEQVTTAYL
ncbi:FAD-binding protein [Acinetobacter bouvetii]|uniref:FAD-binding protein n=1 Tax=Acinetobacter bouvetii TaxID=202951 RepID=A0A4Q7AU04_9GAMM|nr:FAD-dependent monooxygenase [Acinetobacter bouvetii]RZG66904.1 FAD-binding protein [Acinetobacter bouvetii]